MKITDLFDRGEFAISAEVGPPKGIHIEHLVEENRTLEETYKASYTLSDVEKTALALGMVPAEQVEHVRLGN